MIETSFLVHIVITMLVIAAIMLGMCGYALRVILLQRAAAEDARQER